MMGGSSPQVEGEPESSSQPAAPARPNPVAPPTTSRKKRREEGSLGIPKYGCSMCHWVSSGCEECRPDYGMGAKISTTGPKAKRLRLKEILQSKGAELSPSAHIGLVKQEYTPTPAGCSPAHSLTTVALAAPTAEGTLTLQQILTSGVTYTDSGRACKPPQVFVPGVTPKRPNSAKKAKREQLHGSALEGRRGTPRPGTTLGMVGYPTVGLAGRESVPPKMIKVMHLDGSLGGPHLVHASVISADMRRCRWPEAEVLRAKSPARPSPEATEPAATATPDKGTHTANAAAGFALVHTDTSEAHAMHAAAAAAAASPVVATSHSDEFRRRRKKKRRRSVDSGTTSPSVEGNEGSVVPVGPTTIYPLGATTTVGTETIMIVPSGTTTIVPSEDAAPSAAYVSVSPSELRPVKRAKRSKKRSKWLAERVLPGFDSTSKMQLEEAMANPLRTLLCVNAHCLDVIVTETFASWHDSVVADVDWPLVETSSELDPPPGCKAALQRVATFKTLYCLPSVTATQGRRFLSSQLGVRQRTTQRDLPLPRAAAKAVAAIPLLQLRAVVRAPREEMRLRKPIAPTRCMPGDEQNLPEFPLPPTATLPEEPWSLLPEPAHPAGRIQDLCASLRAGYVPLLRQSDDPLDGTESAATTVVASESDAAVPGESGSELSQKQSEGGEASVDCSEYEEADRADSSLVVPCSESDHGSRNSAEPVQPSTGRNSCASDAAATSDSSSGDPSDTDDAGRPPREKSRSKSTTRIRAPAPPSVPTSGGIGSNAGYASEGSARGSHAERTAAVSASGKKPKSVSTVSPRAGIVPSSSVLDILPPGESASPAERLPVRASQSPDPIRANKGAAGATSGATRGSDSGQQGVGQAPGQERGCTVESMLEDMVMDCADLSDAGRDDYSPLALPEWTPHRLSAMEAAGDEGPTAALEAISNLFELESPGVGSAGSPVGTPAPRSSKSVDFGATALRAGNQQNMNPALAAVPGSRTPRKVAFSEHVQANEFWEEQPRRDTPYKVSSAQLLPRSQQFASLSMSLGSPSRLLNWPGSRVQALAAADARALDVAKVLEIPRQLKYARKAKHCSPNAAFSIQALPMWTLEEQKFREAYLNAKLAQKWLEPELHPWAALDFAGVEFADDACSKHIQHYGKVAAELVHSKGKAAVEELQMTVEREWLQLKAIRRRFNGGSSPVMGDKQDKDSPVMSGPPKIRSILKRRSSVRPPSPLPAVLLSGCLAGHVDLPLARTLLTDDAAVAAIAL